MKDRVEHGSAPEPEQVVPRPTAEMRRRERIAMLRLVQAKLAVGASGDRYEREADQIADRVTEAIQRMSAGSETDPVADVEAHRCGAGCVHRHAGHAHDLDHDHDVEVGAAGGDLGEHLTRRVQQAAGGGTPLTPSVRRPMEAAFGADFGGVRVHADSDVAPRIGASAFTLGNDIHFAPGQYHPGDRSGTWLLSHELTHVVQQGGSGGCVRRHASKEHFILGALSPKDIRSIAIANDEATIAKAASGSKITRVINGTQAPVGPEVDEAKTAIDEQLVGLDNWRTVSGHDDQVPLAAAKANRGKTAYNHTWGGQLLLLRCLGNEEVPCTIGDMNALPDFIGSYDDLRNLSASVVFKTLQVIRRETYVYLKQLRARLDGGSYAYDTDAEAFTGIEKNKVSLPNAALPGVGNAAFDVMQTTTMLEGKASQGETGLDEAVAADATLGRNACHFPPESWLRWREHHLRARSLINGAVNLQDLNIRANQAIGINAWGEHYLQDSYAAGHLINKSFVMAVAMEHVTWATKKARGWTDLLIHDVQVGTAHRDAYDVPAAAHLRETERQAGTPKTRGTALDKQSSTTARDPQTALEAAKAEGSRKLAEGASQAAASSAAKRKEVAATGIGPHSGMTFEQYRTWLNDFWLQKITNTLHDKYCLKGLWVSSPDHANLFKVYGDSSMINSPLGAQYTAETSQMSRHAINALAFNKRRALTPVNPAGPPQAPVKVVPTPEAIMSRFPDTVRDDDGKVMSLKDWATGTPMRKKIAELVAFFTQERWKEGKLTALIKAGSLAKDVAPGLTPDHGPF